MIGMRGQPRGQCARSRSRSTAPSPGMYPVLRGGRARFRYVDTVPHGSRGAEAAPQILRPAFAKEPEQRVELTPRQGGKRFGGAWRHGPRPGAPQARWPFRAPPRQPLDAVTPPVEPSEQAHQDDLGMRFQLVDPKVDRSGMAQIPQICEPDVGTTVPPAVQAPARPANRCPRTTDRDVAGGWRRSTASTRSSREAAVVPADASLIRRARVSMPLAVDVP